MAKAPKKSIGEQLDLEGILGSAEAPSVPASPIPSAGGVGGSVGGMLSKIGKFASAHKVATALTVAPFALDLLPGLLKGARGSLGDVGGFLPGPSNNALSESYVQGSERIEAAQAAAAERQRRFRLLQAQNTQLLFQNAPHLAAQIMAGRELPEDAVVIGGQPRVDLLQDVAAKMTSGHYPNPTDGMGA